MTWIRFIPPEVIDLIVFYLCEIEPGLPPLRLWDVDIKPSSQGLARYATISRSWQFAIERYTFASIVTFSDDLPRLQRIIGSCSRRRSHVKNLWFYIDLPLYADSRRYFVERPEEHQANLTAFQQGVQSLWNELSGWGKECHPHGLRLVLNAEAPIDRDPQTGRHSGDGELTDRWEYVENFLSLCGHTRLPLLSSVVEFGVSFTGRSFHPSAIEALVLSLPTLRRLHLFVGSPKPKNHELRAKHRSILARALSSPTLHHLEFLSIRMWYQNPNNHSWDMSPAHDPSYTQGDVLGQAICTLAQRSLRFLNLTGAYPISPDLWGGGEQSTATNSPTEIIFPYLEKVYISHSHITYDGRWLYTGHSVPPPDSSYCPGYPNIYIDYPAALPLVAGQSYDSKALELGCTIDRRRDEFENGEYPFHMWRGWPDPEKYHPWLRSLVHAVQKMPSLKCLWTEFYMRMLFGDRIMMQIVAPGEEAGVLHWTRTVEYHIGQWRWIVLVEQDLRDMQNWEVPADILQLMRNTVGETGAVAVQKFP